MSWDPSMGYYGGDADDEYEEQDDYQPPQRQQRNAPKSPGLRAYMKQQANEIKALKRQVEQQQSMLGELLEGGDSPQLSQGVPQSRLTDAEQQQMQRMMAMGVLGVAGPQGTQNEQINAIRAARSPEELTNYLRSQGSVTGTDNYSGMGY